MSKHPRLLIVFLVSFVSLAANSQLTCSSGLDRLYKYTEKVNTIYEQEYTNVIPNQRCAMTEKSVADDRLVVNCRNQLFSGLNYWYQGQCHMINNWYAQIGAACSVNAKHQEPALPVRTGSEKNQPTNLEPINQLKSAIKQNGYLNTPITLSIPDSPSPFSAQ